MRLITEEEARRSVTLPTAIEAVEECFRDLAEGRASLFPAVRERLANAGGTFGIKSGQLERYGIVGLKAGGYWPGNAKREPSIDNHQSTVLLFEQTTGRSIAAVAANWLTEARTAAVGALAIRTLAREDSRSLGIIGTGKQALSQVEAAFHVRPFETVTVSGRDDGRADELCRQLDHRGIKATVARMETTVRSSDVLITITPSTDPLFPADWSPQGQHVNAMGADTRGKRELAPELIGRSVFVYDDLQQSRTLGELESLPEEVTSGSSLGDLLAGRTGGRTSTEERTVFDSTGIALQDLVVAVRAAEIQGGGFS